MCVQLLSYVWLFVTPWTVAHQIPLFMEFSSKNTGMGCHFLLQGIILTQGLNPHLLCLQHWQVTSLTLQHLGISKEKKVLLKKINAVIYMHKYLRGTVLIFVNGTPLQCSCLEIPWMEEPGRLQSIGSLRVGHDWVTSLSCIGEGNGNPLQSSCLENFRDGGAWWAAVYGAAQSWTQLKWLSSSSSTDSYNFEKHKNNMGW